VAGTLNLALLLGVRYLSRTCYRFDVDWVSPPPEDPWADLSLLAILNHTSLYEPLFAGAVPNRLMREIARRGVVPVAEKTLRRPLVGSFFRLVAPTVIPVTRMRDESWLDFSRAVAPGSLVVILPEGRMKRTTGLDAEGNPMTVRGGIADVLRALPGGRFLIVYSGGLHHVQAPGETFPRLFKTLRMRLESLDVEAYREELLGRVGERGFKQAVVRDLEARRDCHCPPLHQTMT
jgi:1-acyl-sn-glycerol-3-phosphate acyltransferase